MTTPSRIGVACAVPDNVARHVSWVPDEAKFTVCPGVAVCHVLPPSLDTCTDTEVPDGT